MPTIIASEFSLGEQSHHLSGSGCVFIHQNDDLPMKGLRAQSLRFKNNRLLGAEFDGKGDQLSFLGRDLSQPWKTFLRSPFLRSHSVETVTHWLAARCEQTHQPQIADAPTGIPSKIK